MKFTDLQLHPEILRSINKLGYESCTPIQESVIPLALEGKDVAGLAQTGTGKTAAFVIPLLDRVARSKSAQESERDQKRVFSSWKSQEFILILVPTRELVDQVASEVEKLRGDLPIKVLTIYGGTGYDKQTDGLKSGVEFIVGTPGRLIDLYKSHVVDFRQVRAVVFDEADRMFDMGFRDDMKFILRRLPKERQFLVFSATLNFEVLNIAYMFGAEPIECNVSRDQAKADNVKDQIFHCGQNEKPQFLLSLLKRDNAKQVIIFSNFKHNVERISNFLNENNYPAVAISSLLTQAQRNRVIDQFKAQNEVNILVATDVAARGLDIKGVDLIVNYDLPDDPENYVHRIGRTGRAGETGQAASFVSDRDVEALQRIEDYLKHKVSVGWMEDADLIKEFVEYSYLEPHRRGTSSRGAPAGRGATGARSSKPPRTGEMESRPRGRERSGGYRPKDSSTLDPRAARQRDDRSGYTPRAPPRDAGGRTNTEPHKSGPSGQHRDRAMGRHSRGNEETKKDARTNQRLDGGSHRGPHLKREYKRGSPRSGPDLKGRRPQAAAAGNSQNKRRNTREASGTKTLGQRITGFLKNILGR